ncbi:peptidoglycan-associated lipoprotein Pal [Paracoccus sp. Z118]|uniref:peptidoglycan-associated lipoprotein Pal n=1 Tax=Paracoccus sp. Z118 TaxID=2851017 RepID=UPI001C2BD691|nr:peptidoglycan-associated lipoprotein Pal [Paracoccus sp. Z118]MBV0891318.1 peptidoglycan-associated lipoprotein Pal [Paracoccus sp. Z118]
MTNCTLRGWKPAALLLALTLSACAPVAAPVVTDPYAGAPGAGGLYPGQPGGSLFGTAEYFRTNVGDTVLFARDQVTLSDEARATLTRQADWLAQHGSFSTTIQGHSDEQGTREFNLALGARRAGAVQEYLISRGVAPNRIRTVSFGKERPAAVCSDEACFAQNRRAVTVVQPGAGT